MKRIILFFLLALLLLAVWSPAGPAWAAPFGDGGRVIPAGETVEDDLATFGGGLRVEAGATVDGDVSVYGGTAELGGEITGDVNVFGGSAEVSGLIDGDLVAFGGSVELARSAQISGDCFVFGGSLAADGLAQADCQSLADEWPGVVQGLVGPEALPNLPPLPGQPPEAPARPDGIGDGLPGRGGWWAQVSEAAGAAVVLGMLALAVALVAPRNLSQVSQTLTANPVASGTVGVLTAVAGPALILVLLLLSTLLILALCVGLLGYPIVLALSILLLVGGLMGWVAVGTAFGRRLAGWLKLENRGLPLLAALGTAGLTFAFNLLPELPFLLGGWLFWIAGALLFCVGLGAVALTRFGTRRYPPALSDSIKVHRALATLPADE
ncbi:MAG: bactofilin family protein [Candidatus Promineifilaceae bacterium]